MPSPICTFFIPRGDTSRYVYIFNYYGLYYLVTKKVKMGNAPYRTISTVNIPSTYIQTYINTVVALTY
jgi:hypothetical protein